MRSAKSALLVYLQSNVPFSCAEEKYHPSPCYGKQERTCISSKRKEEHSFSKGKRKGRSFCTVTKGTKNTEKGRRLPLPFSNPSPLTNGGIEPFRYALSLQQLQDRKETKSDSLSKTRQRKPVQTLRKVGHHSKTLQNLQQHWSRAVRSRQAVCTRRTQSQSRGSGFAPHGSRCDPQKAFLDTFAAPGKSIIRFPFSWEKGTPPPWAGDGAFVV